jgi:hypothetical protein
MKQKQKQNQETLQHDQNESNPSLRLTQAGPSEQEFHLPGRMPKQGHFRSTDLLHVFPFLVVHVS